VTKSLTLVFSDTRALLNSFGSGDQSGFTRSDTIGEVIRDFVERLPRSYRVTVPGMHTGGISHDGLLLSLASGGRDFLASTVQLIQAVRRALTQAFTAQKILPTIKQLQDVAGTAILAHIEKRFGRGNGDVLMEPLTPAYQMQKARKGRGMQPIGVATGELRAAFQRAEVKWL